MLSKKKLFDDAAIVAQLSAHFTASASLLVHSNVDVETRFLIENQVRDLAKKFVPLDFDTGDLALDAYLLFSEVNATMASVNHYPFPNPSILQGLGNDQRILLRARNLVHQILGSFHEDEFFSKTTHSSGASIGVPYSDTSIEAKSSGLSYTPGIQQWFSYYLSYDPQLKTSLESFGPSYMETRGSRATTVPKDKSKVRMICIEPTLNMFFQQGLMHYLTSRLELVGLSFSSQQDTNKYLAWLSSLTGSHATIDWSSASDSLSESLVRFLLPNDWFYYLDTFRCKEIEILGGFEKLSMFSTMGNATTFPLETLVFFSLATAVCSMEDNLKSTFVDPKYLSYCSVFGDDCIVPSQHAEPFINLLSRIGFKPNLKKTFLKGPFRESCGGDFLSGKDVRPYHLTGPNGRKSHHLHAWINVMFNRLKSICIRICGPLTYIYHFWNVFDYLFSLLRDFQLKLFIVPTHYPDDSGFKLGIDFARFRRHFSIRTILSPVTCDQHGSKHFKYLKATFLDRKETYGSLRYWLAIKGLSLRNSPYYFVRRRFSYVVAKGCSPWMLIER